MRVVEGRGWGGGGVSPKGRVWTPKIHTATRPFFKFDMATRAFLKIDMRHGELSDMATGVFRGFYNDQICIEISQPISVKGFPCRPILMI